MEEEPFDGATSGVPFECRSTNILLRCIVACCNEAGHEGIKCIAKAGVC